MLSLRNISTGYGGRQVLFGLSAEVSGGEIVAVIGPNGAGKSSALKAVCGLIPLWQGEIRFDDERLSESTPAENMARGITFCPQGNRVFSDLTVKENLEVGGYLLPRKEMRVRTSEVLGLFPCLRDRLRQKAGTLSGGERQMVAFARAMVSHPKLLILDEPSLGLAPQLVREVFDRIVQVNQDRGVAVLIVEQKVHEVLRICHRVYSLKLGRIAFAGLPEELRTDPEKLRYLFF